MKMTAPVLSLTLLVACPAGMPHEAPTAQNPAILRWIEKLGSSDIEERVRAEAELGLRWEAAEIPLRAAKDSPDAEVRIRVARLLERIAWNRNPPLAFLSPNAGLEGVYRIDPASGVIRELFAPLGGGRPVLWHLAWSPDARLLSFCRDELGVSLVGSEGEDLQVVAAHEASSNRSLRWSPDGRHIAFVTEIETAEGAGERERVSVLTVASGEVIHFPGGKGNSFDPEWSPDGSRLAFVSDRVKPGDSFDIYVSDVNGGGVRRLSSDGEVKFRPRWSPDGTEIAFTMGMAATEVVGILTVGTGQVRRLCRAGKFEYYAAWSPDSSHLCFIREVGSGDGIALMVSARDGSQERILVAGRGNKLHPCWSPDGRRLAFEWDRGGVCQIFTVNSDGTGLTQVTKLKGGATEPAWAPFR